MKHRLNGFASCPTFKLRRLDQGFSKINHEANVVHTLFDLSARVVAESLPFEYVEKTLVHVPEPVQEKIIYYSFPRRDSDIYTYASFHPKSDKGRDKIPYYEGLDYFQNDCVEDVIQIGFHLTGSVRQPLCVASEPERRKFEVSITFDRCKIISVCCDCGNKGLSWCPHVVALALYRIRQPHLVDYRSPISDALVRMDRSQLQKFAQYLIASHPNKVLPSAQQLADELLQPESSINRTSGAPDPTAGASVEDVAAWYLDEAGVREQLRAELANLANNGSASGPPSSVTGFGSLGSNGLRSVGGRSTPLMSQSSSGNIGSSTAPTAVSSSAAAFATTHANQSGCNPITRTSSNSFHGDSLQSANHASNSELGQPRDTTQSSSVHSEVGLNWLLRYRRLTLNQTLLGESVPAARFPPTEPVSPLHLGIAPDAVGSTHWFGPQNGPFMNSMSSDALAYGASASSGCSSYLNGSGAQITAMFAKVRELLVKRDSNGPRLLSLITEELLRCPKLPLLKTRRAHRGAELSGRMSMPSLTRSLSAQQLLSPNTSQESGLGANPFSHASSSSAQLPTWTTRLWEEVCLLWTCVVLNPDCNAEARRQWRSRFMSWVRAHRCPRDEAYAIPGHYFANVRDQSELDDDPVAAGAQQTSSSATQQQQQSCRSNSRRASIFQLPLEASFLSWDNDNLRSLIGLECTKKRADTDPDASENDIPSSPTTGLHNNPFDSNEATNATCDFFRRPSSNTPNRRGPCRLNASRDCQCPYCEPTTTQVNEPFPLLCLRVAALRANGYPAQALRLAVFISQRLLQAFKTKATGANNSLVSYGMRSAGQSHGATTSPPWTASYGNEAGVRRSLFAGIGANGRLSSMGHFGTPSTPYNVAGRYPQTAHILPSSTVSSHPKYHSSGRLLSPRPSSISPPVSAVLPRPVSRRHVKSPGPNCAPLCSGPANWNSHGVCSAPSSSSSVYKAIPHTLPPHSLFGTPSPSFSHMMHGYPTAASPSVPPPSPLPFHPHYPNHYHHHQQQHFAQSSPYAFGQTTPYGGATNYSLPTPGRQLTSPKLLGRPASFHAGAQRSLNPSHASNSPYSSGLLATGSGEFGAEYIHAQPVACSPQCPSHTDSAWIGLPGRPVICLVECLLDAAAMVVESNHWQYPSELTLWDQLEPASFYLCLSVKICLLALFQQRRLSGSINRLLFSQAQESRLLSWLSTMPRDTGTVVAVCETMAHLLGPPALSRLLPRSESGLCPNPSTVSTSPSIPSPVWWWWSALGPVIHPDSYPVHEVAHLVLDYVLEVQAQNPVPLVHNFWGPPDSASPLTASLQSFSSSGSASSANGSVSATTPASSIRIDDLLFAVVTRAMRFSVLEPVSDNIGFMSTIARSNHLPAHQIPHPPPPAYNHYQHHPNPYNHHSFSGSLSPFTARSTDRSLYSSRYWDAAHMADLESALAVNTEMGELNPDPTVFISNGTSTPEQHSRPPPTQPGFHHHQSGQPIRVVDTDRWPISPTVHCPPLPSAFASAVQACIKLLDIPYTQSGSCMPIPPVFSTPCFSPACLAARTSLSPMAYTCEANSLQSQHQPAMQQQQPILSAILANSNAPVRRCLEAMELQQTHLAVALIRLSKSSVQRLDQVVQICDRHIHSAVSLLAISQQIFAEAVGLEPVLTGVRKYDPLPLFSPSLLNTFAHDVCQLGGSSAATAAAAPSSTSSITAGAYSPDRINLICTAYHLALLVVLRTLTPRTVHWRRREMLAWAVSTALHVGPSACLYLVTNWAVYVSPREAVNWLAPALIAVIAKSESGSLPGLVRPSSEGNGGNTGPGKSVPLAGSHADLVEHDALPSSSTAAAASLLLFGPVPADGSATLDHPHGHTIADELHTVQTGTAAGTGNWPSWYGFQPAAFMSRHQTNSITIAAQMLGSAVPYSVSAREHILAAVRHMALQAAAKDPANCALPALTLAERNAAAFDAVYRLVLHSAESGALGVLRLFSLARYMDSRGWAWRAFPFALHATRLFVLSTMQDSHPVANDVLWACSLAHRLGPGALQEILSHVIRNIHCPTLLTEILHRCRVAPAGRVGATSVSVPPNPNSAMNSALLQVDGSGSSQLAMGRNSCPGSFNPSVLYNPMTNSASASVAVHLPTLPPPPPMGHTKLLSLDRPPLKALLDATINAFVTATHTRLANISPRQYAEFVDFLARARDTFHLLRPDGPSQFRSLVECLRQTYRGKRKLVSLLSERFG